MQQLCNGNTWRKRERKKKYPRARCIGTQSTFYLFHSDVRVRSGLSVSTTPRLRHGFSTSVSLVESCWELRLVAAPFRSNNTRQNVAARNGRCQAPTTLAANGPVTAMRGPRSPTDGALLVGSTSPPQSRHDKCPATGEAQPHQQCSVSRQPVPTNNSGGD